MRSRQTKGASLTEYAILMALLGVVVIASALFVGVDVRRIFNDANDGMVAAIDENGGGGGGSIPSGPPSEADKDCVVDAAGPDAMQEDSGRVTYTFPGDCLLITTDGEVSFLVYADNAPQIPYHARINVPAGSSYNSVAFNGGPRTPSSTNPAT